MTKEAVAEKYKEICESGQLNQGTFMPEEDEEKKKKGIFIPIMLFGMIITIAVTMAIALDVGGIYTKIFSPPPIADANDNGNAKQKQLEEYEMSLNLLEGTVMTTLDDMEQQANELEEMSQVLTPQISDMAALVKVYEEMSPIVAADIMSSLDTNMTVSILKNMDSGKIASILSLMNPEVAVKITKSLYPQ